MSRHVDGTFRADDGVEIAYRTWPGAAVAPPIVLHHGFTGDSDRDWVEPGIVAALLAAGRNVVAPDARGHGRSDKPHVPEAYGEARMAADLSGLLDNLGVPEVDVVGFSMGAVVSLIAATGDHRIRRLVVVGVGAAVVEQGGVDRTALSRESLADALAGKTVATGAARAFIDGLKGREVDWVALAMHARSSHAAEIPLARIAVPTLVIAGDTDPFATRPEVLTAVIPGARLEVVEGDHGSCITNPRFIQAVLDFLGG